MTTSASVNDDVPRAGEARRAVLASLVGTTVEWYDFYLYGMAAALVFDSMFFPASNPTAALLAAFATYAVGFIARPLGALVAGHFGDRYGRRPVLVSALLIMGAATTLIGVLPSYDQIGLAAPLLLVALRLGQGFAVGGEWGGAALVAVEHASSHQRGLYGSFTQIGSSAGMLLAAGGFTTVRGLSGDAAFQLWGWRIPFLASAVLIVVGLVIRAKLRDPAVFAQAREDQRLSRNPLGSVFRTHGPQLWMTTGMRLSQIAAYTLYTTFALSYLDGRVDDGGDIGLAGVLVASVIGLVSTPLWAVLSDRVGRKPLYLFGAIGGAVHLGVFFLAVSTESAGLIVVAMVVGINVFHDAMYGPQAAWFTELFGTHVRYSGASIGYQFGSVLGGGLTPLVATSLLLAGNGAPHLVIGYFVGLSVLTALAARWAPETHHLPELVETADGAAPSAPNERSATP